MMANKMKGMMGMLLAVCMLFCMMNASAFSEDITAKKTSDLQDRDSNRYEIEIQVPGKDGDNRHDEVILMVDGSYSMDNEWPAMKEAINTIGEAVLNGSGNTVLTLMAFGMGDNIVLKHTKSASDLAASLGALPGNLLYGRSSTNCEAGFTGVAEYIANHGSSLKDAYVIFISDGNINTDETPRAFDANWQTWTKFGALTVAQETFGGTVSNGENLPAAFTTVFGNRFDGATREEIMERAFGGEVTDEEFITFAEQVWTDVYAYSGLTRGEEYPVSDAERAFVKYDKENGTYIQDLFYYTTYKSAYVTYEDRWDRTPAAAEKLAAMTKVKELYIVDYDSATDWMKKVSGASFVHSNGIAGLVDALKGAISTLAKTPFNDVSITDYTSKWVTLDRDTLRIVDNSTGATIWTQAGGWLTDDIPTAKNPPVVVEKVSADGYAAGGDDVIGNTSGDIYKLTWYVKDGAMLRSDTYSLKYDVIVDVNEDGFRFGTDYPANGNTDLHYKDENGADKTASITVPEVNAPLKDAYVSFEAGSASHICFLYVDKETGEVICDSKYDFDDNDTSAQISSKPGCISVVFIKQAQSGIIWAAEEVSEDVMAKIISSIKKNDKAYKGHDAVAFGEGSHDLTYSIGNGKKAKTNTVSYTFAGTVVKVENVETVEMDVLSVAIDATESEAESDVPAVEATEPEAESDVPAVEATESEADTDAPAVEATEPEAEADVPAVKATEPEAESDAPAVEATEPEAEADVPAVEEPKSEADEVVGTPAEPEIENTVTVPEEPVADETEEEPAPEKEEEEPAEPAKILLSFKKGQASGATVFFVDNRTGKVSYDSKLNFNGKATEAVLPIKEGFTTVVFVRQNHSGMIWLSAKVGSDMIEKIISAIENSDGSYKGFDAIAYGDGSHSLTYEKGNKTHTVTYTFLGSGVSGGRINYEVETPEEETVEEATTGEATEAPEQPEESKDLEESEQPVEPDQPVEPVEPEQPEEPEQTEEPEQPEEAKQPEEPEQTEEPDQPEEPEQPVEPEQPEEPEQSVEPEQPVEPEQSVEPEQPVEPEQSAEPDQPAEPEQSAEPDQPAEPEQPAEPDQPAEPEQSAELEQPAESEQQPEVSEQPEDNGEETAGE